MNPSLRPLVAGLLLACAAPCLAAPLKITLPQEPLGLKKAPGAELLTSQCLVCHSQEYITTLPPLPRAYWKATVLKMQAKFGAPLAQEQMDAITEYLIKNYGKAD